MPSVSAVGPVLIAALCGIVAYAVGTYWLSAIGVGLFAFVLVRFILEWGGEIPVDTLMLATAGLQWIIGPLLSYAGLADHYKYHMYVPEAHYMTLAVPGFLSFVVGVYAFRPALRAVRLAAIRSHAESILHRNDIIPIGITALGVIASLLGQFAPGGLRFVLFVIGESKYIGVLYFIFSGRKERWVVFGSLLTFAAFSALDEAAFHNLFLWTVLLLIYLGLAFRWPLSSRILMVLMGTLVLLGLLAVKREYRDILWFEQYRGSKVALMGHLLNERLNTTRDAMEGAISEVVIRINQGWIISRIMEQVPETTPFAEGDTIRDAVRSSLLPRILFPDKTGAGGRTLYPRFTGYQLWGTSMGLSLLGEGYANYGRLGACAFLFLYGAVVSMFLRLTFRLARRAPTLILWIPLLFLQVIKAETELVVVLNHMTKSIIVVVALMWGMQRILKWRV